MHRSSWSRSSRSAARLRLVLAPFLALGCPADDTDDGATSLESGNDSGSGSTTTTDPGNTATSVATEATSAEESTTAGLITNACGTFDPNEAGDSVIPQDPDDPEIIAACTTLCDALASIADCTTDPATCLESCKLRSCSICPDTLVPLVTCETELFDPAACECGAEGAVCSSPEGCAEESDATSACGG